MNESELQEIGETGLREIDGLTRILAEGSGHDWTIRVRCQGWTIRDLATHVSNGPLLYAEALRRMRDGESEPGPKPPEAEDDAEIPSMLRRGRDDLASVFSTLRPEHLDRSAPAPTRAGSIPGPFAVRIPAYEFGLHRNDLLWALGEEAPLDDALLATIRPLVEALMPVLAARAEERPPAPVAYRFRGGEVDLRLAFDGDRWTTEAAPGARSCLVTGDASSLVLFLMGRIPGDHPNLRAEDVALARRFKTYVPGP